MSSSFSLHHQGVRRSGGREGEEEEERKRRGQKGRKERKGRESSGNGSPLSHSHDPSPSLCTRSEYLKTHAGTSGLADCFRPGRRKI